MGYEEGKRRDQREIFTPSLDEQIAADHQVRVVDAFVDGLEMGKLGFEKAKPAWTGRPGYDPRDMLKLFLYGYINRVRSSRRLQREVRNIEAWRLINSLSRISGPSAIFARTTVWPSRNFQSIYHHSSGSVFGKRMTVDGIRIRANSIKRRLPRSHGKELQYIEEQSRNWKPI